MMMFPGLRIKTFCMMKKIIPCLLIWLLAFNLQSQNLLPEKWKFKTGDDVAWASVTYNDADWATIIPGSDWEQQGYNDYDGYAWYRVTVTVPSTLKEVAKKYGGFDLVLGKIDDVDFTYFNGELIGNLGVLPPKYKSAWDIDRVYRIPVSKIRWDQPNTIAVRVFDLYGGGGLYSRPVLFSARGLSNYVSIDPVFTEPDRILKGMQEDKLTLNISVRKNEEIAGKIVMQVVSDFGKEIFNIEQDLVLKGKSTTAVSFDIPGIQPGFYKVDVTLNGELASKMVEYKFGYEPEKIVSPPDPRPDFDTFWKQTRQELSKVDPQYKLTKIDSLCTKKRTVYLVEMHSLGNVRIHGWYSVPTAPGKYPAIMQVPGYSSMMVPESVDYGADIIGFGLNIRGHGNSRDDVNPGFPGFLFSGIADKETYIYRGAYMDCVRGIDFLYSRPEVDTTRVAVEGGSQGGALTFATAALDNQRIKVCAPLIPFLSDFQDYFKVAVWPANEFHEFVDVEKNMSWDEVFDVLSYFDIKNLAGWIKAPLFMGVGLMDETCPPHINFAAYNQVKSEKHYVVYPNAGHGLPVDFYTRRMVFLRKKLGLK
jgi:cephalosporin-C deacetylase